MLTAVSVCSMEKVLIGKLCNPFAFRGNKHTHCLLMVLLHFQWWIRDIWTVWTAFNQWLICTLKNSWEIHTFGEAWALHAYINGSTGKNTCEGRKIQKKKFFWKNYWKRLLSYKLVGNLYAVFLRKFWEKFCCKKCLWKLDVAKMRER